MVCLIFFCMGRETGGWEGRSRGRFNEISDDNFSISYFAVLTLISDVGIALENIVRMLIAIVLLG